MYTMITRVWDHKEKSVFCLMDVYQVSKSNNELLKITRVSPRQLIKYKRGINL